MPLSKQHSPACKLESGGNGSISLARRSPVAYVHRAMSARGGEGGGGGEKQRGCGTGGKAPRA